MAVKDEFLCSVHNIEEYKELLTFYATLKIAELPKIKQLNIESDGAYFSIALSRCKNISPSYVDRLLLFATYMYRDVPGGIYLITSNHKDVPSELFECVGFVSYNMGGFHNIGVYQVMVDRMEKMMIDINQDSIKAVQNEILEMENRRI
ncbi:hypothetical protein IJ096_03650 [Candidatus Saccharibacteria bacterium]|nr:hypothetical protein [Candidatus Saccharibacteria bacterium]